MEEEEEEEEEESIFIFFGKYRSPLKKGYKNVKLKNTHPVCNKTKIQLQTRSLCLVSIENTFSVKSPHQHLDSDDGFISL